jgi:uncharacterized protein
MNWYFKLILQRPKLTLVALLIVTVLFGLGLPKLKIRNNSDSELPESDPIVMTKNKIDKIFGKKSAVLIGIKTDNIYNTKTLEKIAAISLELEKIPKVIPNEITSLATVNNVVGTADGLAVGKLIKKIPSTPQELQEIENMVEANDMLRGALVSKDHTFTAIIANLEDGADQGAIHKEVYALIEKYQGPEILYASGEKIFAEEIDTGVQKDSNVLTPISLLVIMGLLFFFLRSIRGVALPWLAIVLSIVWTMGFMGHIGLMQSVVSSMLPALLVIIGSTFGIHIMMHYYVATAENPTITSKEAATVSVEHLLRPILLAGITSSMGAISLVVFDVLSIREFGFIFTAAIIFSLILCITIIPCFLSLLKVQVREVEKMKGTRWLNSWLQWSTKKSVERPYQVLGCFGLIVTISLVGISQIKTGLDIASIFPADHRGKISLDAFGDNLGGVRVLSVMIEAPESGGIKDPAYLRKIFEFEKIIKEQDGVGHATSFADVVMQVAKSLNSEWGGIGKIPEHQEEIAQYLFLYDISGTPGDFANLVDYDYRRARIQITLNSSNPNDHERIYAFAKNYWDQNIPAGGKAEFGGDTLFWIAQSQYVVSGKVINVISSVLTILLFVALVYRSLSAGIISVVPVIIGGLVTFGVMGFAGIRLDIAAACISGITAGIGIDFALHYLDCIRGLGKTESTISRACDKAQVLVGRWIIYDAITNAFGFLVVTISSFVIVKNFGYLLAISMLSTAISVIFLMPVLLMMFKPNFVSREFSFWQSNKSKSVAAKENDLPASILNNSL